MSNKKNLSSEQEKKLLKTLQTRFEKNMNRHKGIERSAVEKKLQKNTDKLWSLNEMENTGWEPDMIWYDKKTGEYTYCDCAPESPAGRRSICYDNDALASRKEHKPKNSAQGMAYEMGIEILTEEQYRELQTLWKFDTKTSSWIQAPAAIRKLGWAIFADYRYDTVFVYHNGAESYYAGRAFRGILKV